MQIRGNVTCPLPWSAAPRTSPDPVSGMFSVCLLKRWDLRRREEAGGPRGGVLRGGSEFDETQLDEANSNIDGVHLLSMSLFTFINTIT